MEFKDLTPGFKTLVIFGYVFSILCLILIIVIIVITTDSNHLGGDQVIEKELEGFDDFLKEFEGGVEIEDSGYKHKVKDLNGNPTLNLLSIELL